LDAAESTSDIHQKGDVFEKPSLFSFSTDDSVWIQNRVCTSKVLSERVDGCCSCCCCSD